MHEGGRASGGRRGRRTVALVLVVALAGLVSVVALVVVQRENAAGTVIQLARFNGSGTENQNAQ